VRDILDVMSFRSLRSRALVAALGLLAALVLCASALAATPFGGLGGTTSTPATTTTQSATTAPPVTIPSTTTSGGGISTITELGIAVAALGVFGTIIYVIRRDAHLHAPRHAARDIDRGRATVAPRTERIKRSRAKAKAARRARKSRR
jgi:hypothetical protein